MQPMMRAAIAAVFVLCGGMSLFFVGHGRRLVAVPHGHCAAVYAPLGFVPHSDNHLSVVLDPGISLLAHLPMSQRSDRSYAAFRMTYAPVPLALDIERECVAGTPWLLCRQLWVALGRL